MSSSRQRNLFVRQLNMHHCKGAAALIDSQMNMMQTKNQKMIYLLQEPWVNRSKIQGFNPCKYSIYYAPGIRKHRTCIVGTKGLDLVLLPHFSDELMVEFLESIRQRNTVGPQGDSIHYKS